MNGRHLFLTSSGLNREQIGTFFGVIGKHPQDMKILYIPTAGIETDEAREGIAIALYELSLMGVRSENILVYNLELLLSKGYARTYSAHVKEEHIISRLLSAEEMRGFDVVLVSGGDPAVLCREMVRTGFDDVLKRAVDDGLVYVGVSAGSMYAAGNLEQGLCVISNPIVPHWDGERMTSIPTDGEAIRLADGQVVYVEGGSVSLI